VKLSDKFLTLILIISFIVLILLVKAMNEDRFEAMRAENALQCRENFTKVPGIRDSVVCVPGYTLKGAVK
jgi:flagellar biogenesis protein FliO